jgi:hypothetical protein
MSGPVAKMTPEQTAAIAAGIAVAQTFAAGAGAANPTAAAGIALASSILQGILAAQATGGDYHMGDFNAAVAQFDQLREEAVRLQREAAIAAAHETPADPAP